MPSYTYGFIFIEPKESSGITQKRPYLPLILINPFTSRVVPILSLVDTGADRCVIGSDICTHLGHNFKGKNVQTGFAYGLDQKPTPIWKHTFIIQIEHPDIDGPIWESKPQFFDCADIPRMPVLLGTDDFLCNFKLTFDYLNAQFTVEW